VIATILAGQYVDCEFYLLLIVAKLIVLTSWLDFRMLAKATEAGKTLTPNDVEHLMALFGTFPPNVESEP
jgi:hypothetical protein